MKECLFNTCSNNVVGYCRYHHASMTVKQMKCKNCLQKECRHLVKNEEHPYWRQRELTKQKRKNRKQKINEYIATVVGGV
jgi:hypothetical protein